MTTTQIFRCERYLDSTGGTCGKPGSPAAYARGIRCDECVAEHEAEREAARAKTLLQTEENLLSGRYFHLCSESARSRYGYQPPVNHRDYGHVIETLGKMAGRGDQFAQMAAAIVGAGLNLYGTDAQIIAKVYEAAARTLSNPYDDVLSRSGPEATRFKDAQRPWSLGFRVELEYWLTACFPTRMMGSLQGVGWPIAELAKRENVYPTAAERCMEKRS